MSLPSVFGLYGEGIETELKSLILGQGLPLYRLMAYQMGWVDEQGEAVNVEPDQRIRSTLCLLTCDALGGDPKEALPAAAALELAHNFSLIHNDIQDGTPERHHRPTVWWLWGPAQGINAGDAMHALARLSLLRQTEKGMAPEQALKAVAVLDTACLHLCEGQYLELAYRERVGTSLEAYFQIAEGKAALMGCAAELGAVTAFADEGAVQAMARYGQKLGLASQVREDILGLWGSGGMEEPRAGDVLGKRTSLPLVYAMQHAGGADKRFLSDVYSKRVMDLEDSKKIIEVLDRVGARDFSQEKANTLCQEALQALDEAALSSRGQEELEELAHFLVTRDT